MWQTAVDYVGDVARDLLVGWLGKTLASTVLTVCLGCIGGWDKLASGLFLLVCMDFALGFARGWLAGCLSRAKFRRGLAKFFLYFAAIMAAYTLDNVLNVKTGAVLHIDFRAGLVMYLSINETLSILGHLRSLGVPLPQALIQRLTAYRDCAVFAGRSRSKGDGRG